MDVTVLKMAVGCRGMRVCRPTMHNSVGCGAGCPHAAASLPPIK